MKTSQLQMDRIGSIEDLKASLGMAKDFRIKHSRPFITISYAQSVDGRICRPHRHWVLVWDKKNRT